MATQKTDPIFDYIAQAKQAEEKSKQNQINVASILSEQEASSNEAALQTAAAGRAQQGVISAKQSILAATDAQKAAIVETYGTDYTKQGSDVLRWSEEARSNREAAFVAEKKLREAQKVDFMSNPLGFISAQFELPTLAAQYNYHAGLSNSAEANIDSIVNNTTSAANMVAVTAKSTSTELAIAEGEKAAADFATQVAKIKADSAGQRIQGINVLNNMSAQDLDRSFKVRGAINDDKRLKLAEESNALQREARAFARQEAADKLEAKQTALDAVKQEMEAYNAGARRAGKVTFTDPKMFLATYNSNKNLPEFTNVLTSGKLIMMNDGVTNGVMVADNAGEAALIYASGQAQGPVAKFLKKTLQDVKQVPTAPKDRQGLIGSVDNIAKELAKKQSSNIDQASPETNIYSAPPAAVVLQSKATNYPMINSVIRPMVEKNPSAPITDEMILSTAVAYAKKDKANFNEAAAALVSYYQAAVEHNNLTNQYTENGLPEQKKYPARVGGKIVDLTDPIQVKRHLLQESMPAMGSTPFGFR